MGNNVQMTDSELAKERFVAQSGFLSGEIQCVGCENFVPDSFSCLKLSTAETRKYYKGDIKCPLRKQIVK